MTTNPFGKLDIRRGYSDDENVNRENIKNLLDPIETDDRKKRKVRPNTEELQAEDQGFEMVNKKGKIKQSPFTTEEPISKELSNKSIHKVPYMYRQDVVHTKSGKRLYDRHSGTGRGKEVAKGGAGGLHTWGDNPKAIALESTKHLNDPSLEGADEEASIINII